MRKKTKILILCIIIFIVSLYLIKRLSSSYFLSENLRNDIMQELSEDEIIDSVQYRSGSVIEHICRTTTGIAYIKTQKHLGIVWQKEIAVYRSGNELNQPVLYVEQSSGENNVDVVIYGVCNDENISELVLSYPNGDFKELSMRDSKIFSIKLDMSSYLNSTPIGLDKYGEKIWGLE